jgi:hypothetical protein
MSRVWLTVSWRLLAWSAVVGAAIGLERLIARWRSRSATAHWERSGWAEAADELEAALVDAPVQVQSLQEKDRQPLIRSARLRLRGGQFR